MKKRVSSIFNLGRTQPSLDFVDVDINGDTSIFVDPMALRQLTSSEWAMECVWHVQTFFRSVLKAIADNDSQAGLSLLGSLHEPNETHLGFSSGNSKGHALGTHLAEDVWKALSNSKAVTSGLLEDLEDTILMIPGISNDVISDITTNIIRGPLIRYTQQMCQQYNIPMQEGLDSGPIWDPSTLTWGNRFERLPVAKNRKLLLIPKAIVRRRMEYSDTEYYGKYILPYLMREELNANTSLVHLLKNGERRVYKKDLINKFGKGKSAALRETLRTPHILSDYRLAKRSTPVQPLTHYDFGDSKLIGVEPDWDALLNAVISLPTGNDAAPMYESAVEKLFTAMFYPSLIHPRIQLELHEGRKRIDITYTNMADRSFFKWLSMHYASSNVFIECKNYGSEVANPELDQLAGRFSPTRGQFGVIVCRKFKNKEHFEKRCRDTAIDHRGFIVTLDDIDLKLLVEAQKANDPEMKYDLLMKKFNSLLV